MFAPLQGKGSEPSKTERNSDIDKGCALCWIQMLVHSSSPQENSSWFGTSSGPPQQADPLAPAIALTSAIPLFTLKGGLH